MDHKLVTDEQEGRDTEEDESYSENGELLSDATVALDYGCKEDIGFDHYTSCFALRPLGFCLSH